MQLGLTNSKDIVVNSVAVIKGNRSIDLAETSDAVEGLAPETLNSLEKLVSSLNGDAKYFQTVTFAFGNKADKSTTYAKTQADALLDAKVDCGNRNLRHQSGDLQQNRHR